jgi:hypothetical protein
MTTLKPGDKVRARGRLRRIAYVAEVIQRPAWIQIKLDRPLCGYAFWHPDDLVLVPDRKARP